MKVLVAVNEFKGSLSSIEIGNTIKSVISKRYTNLEVLTEAVADGGDGFLDIFNDFEKKQFKTVNAASQDIIVSYLENLVRKEAVIEIAEVIGLKQLLDVDRDPYKTSTLGLGKLINHLLNKGIKHFIIGLGGSATNDCGIGMLSELGVRFLSESGKLCRYGIKDLSEICEIDLSGINQKLEDANFTIISDVNNPLYGRNGATYVYSGQKGLDERNFAEVDKYITNFSKLVSEKIKNDFSNFEGSGAAGGLGFAFLSFCNSRIQGGSKFMIEYLDLEQKISEIDILITGEGKLDSQSYMGKAPIELAKIAKKYNKKVIFLAGSILDEQLNQLSDENKKLVDSSFTVQREFLPLENAMNKDVTIKNIENTVIQIFNLLEINNG
ncbi:glycerate kinase [uncultured Gemella sp.]|uniref:glycerate kinase n=1 Tax=uncultured Gemella sp. TaxID=254352 RepID=UPI0028D1C286|nr:glycerate kinase [uncultured Gemella sp.]